MVSPLARFGRAFLARLLQGNLENVELAELLGLESPGCILASVAGPDPPHFPEAASRHLAEPSARWDLETPSAVARFPALNYSEWC